MEAAAVIQGATTRELRGEKATRIVEAMRASVAERGIADGVMIRRMSEPELDVRALMDQAVLAARALLA